jgi:hypothetical protein
MPLTNNVIIQLNHITTMINDKNSLNSNDEDFIKSIFNKILQSGDTYNVEEIESWFENEGSWKSKRSIARITNMSHYLQDKHIQSDQFRILSDDKSCNCE